MGRRRSPDESTRHRAGAYRRIRVEPDRADAWRVRLGLARSRGRCTRRGRSASRHVHAHRDAAEVADRPSSGHSADRCRWPSARLRLAPSLRFLVAFVFRPHRSESARRSPSVTASIRPSPYWQTDNEFGCHHTVVSYSPAAVGRFREWLKARYQTHRCAEPCVGHGVLEHGVPQLRRDRRAGGDRHRSASVAPARLPPLRLRRSGALQPHAGRDHSRAFAGPAGRAQLHAALHRVRSLQGRGRSRHRRAGTAIRSARSKSSGSHRT